MNKKGLFAIALKYIVIEFVFFSFFKYLFDIIDGLFVSRYYHFAPVLGFFTLTKIIIIGAASCLLFVNSEKIANKLITDNSETNITKKFILQVAIIVECVSGIIYSFVNFAVFLFDTFRLSGTTIPVEYRGTAIIYLLILIISAVILVYNEKIADYIIKKIPNKIWSD